MYRLLIVYSDSSTREFYYEHDHQITAQIVAELSSAISVPTITFHVSKI